MLTAHGRSHRLTARQHYEREQRRHQSLERFRQERVSGELPAVAVELEIALQELTSILAFAGVYHPAFSGQLGIIPLRVVRHCVFD